MADRAGKLLTPIARILTPRNLTVAIIAILLPFVILPVILGYLGYSKARSDVYQSTSIELGGMIQGIDAQVSRWQSNGLERVQALSQDPAVVTAAAGLESTRTSTDQFFQSIFQLQPEGEIFSDYAVVDISTNTIVATTNPAWENISLGDTNALSPAPTWTAPFSLIQLNQPVFCPQKFSVLTGSPLQSTSQQTGLYLVGVMQIQDLYTILANPLESNRAEIMLLTFGSSTYTRVNSDIGDFSDLEFVLPNSRIPATSGAASAYTDVFGKTVVGYMQPLSLLNLEGGQEVSSLQVKAIIEKDQATVLTALNGLLLTLGLIGLAILAALAVAAFQAVIFITRPTNQLASAVSRFASGHTDEQIPVYKTSEYNLLAMSLSRLTGSLRDVSQLIGTDGQSSTRKIVLLAEFIQSVSVASTLDDALQTITKFVIERLGLYFSAIYMVDDAGQFAIIREATGTPGERLKAAANRFPLGSYSIVGSVAQAGRSHHAPNVSEDPMYIRNDQLPDTRSEVALPIRISRKTIGVLDVHANVPEGFSAEDMDLLQSIADQTGTAIQNVQTAETARVGTEVSQQLFRIGRLVSMAATTEEIYKSVIDGLKGSPYVVTILQSGESSMLIKGFYDPVNPDALEAPVAEVSETPDALGHLLPSTTPLVLKMEGGIIRIPPGVRQYLELLGCRAAAFLPMRQGENLFGVFMLSSRDENAITLATIRQLTPVGESILSAMERHDLLRTTQDRLTELATLNRVSQSISQAIDLQSLFETVHEQTRNALGDVDIIITLYNANRDLLSFPYAFIHGDTVNLDTISVGDSLYALVIRNAQPLLLSENIGEAAAALGVHLSGVVPQSQSGMGGSGSQLTGTTPKSWLGVPLITANQVVGALVLLDTEKENRFSDNDLRLLSTIATQIASTIRTSSLLQESERKAVQLQTAAEIARETIGLLDLDRLLSHSINLIRDRFGFYHSSVFLLDDERKNAVLRESTGEAGRQMKARGHKLGVGSQSIVGWVTQNARPRVADDVTADPIHRANPLLPATRAELGIPLRIGETVIGALDVQSTLPYAFAPDDITILQVIADQIAIAVENARLFSTTREYLARHRSLYQVTTAAASSTTLDNALFSAAQGLRVTMNGARVALFLLNPEKDGLVVRAHSGFSSREVEKMQVPFGQGVQGWVAVNKQPSLVASTAADSRYLMIDPDIQSELCVPLIHRDELLGVLDIQSAQVAAFSEDDVQLLGTVAGSLSAIMSSTVLYEQVTEERERLRHLYEEAIGMAGPPAGDMDTLMRSALERVRSVSGADCVSIAFPSGEDEVKIEMCTCEPHLKHITGLIAHYGEDVLGEALSTNQAVKYTPASTGTLSRSLAQAGVKTALALPLQWTGRTIGGLLLSRMASERLFSTEEAQLANLLALQVAATIESARLFDQTRRQAEREHLLFEITSRIRRSVDMQGILTTTASELSRALGAKHASIKLGLVEKTNSVGGDGGESQEQSG